MPPVIAGFICFESFTSLDFQNNILRNKERIMPNSRDILKTAASATAGAFVLPLQATPAKRREVFIGKRLIKTVDVHGHFVFPEAVDVVTGTMLALNANQNEPLML